MATAVAPPPTETEEVTVVVTKKVSIMDRIRAAGRSIKNGVKAAAQWMWDGLCWVGRGIRSGLYALGRGSASAGAMALQGGAALLRAPIWLVLTFATIVAVLTVGTGIITTVTFAAVLAGLVLFLTMGVAGLDTYVNGPLQYASLPPEVREEIGGLGNFMDSRQTFMEITEGEAEDLVTITNADGVQVRVSPENLADQGPRHLKIRETIQERVKRYERGFTEGAHIGYEDDESLNEVNYAEVIDNPILREMAQADENLIAVTYDFSTFTNHDSLLEAYDILMGSAENRDELSYFFGRRSALDMYMSGRADRVVKKPGAGFALVFNQHLKNNQTYSAKAARVGFLDQSEDLKKQEQSKKKAGQQQRRQTSSS